MSGPTSMRLQCDEAYRIGKTFTTAWFPRALLLSLAAPR